MFYFAANTLCASSHSTSDLIPDESSPAAADSPTSPSLHLETADVESDSENIFSPLSKLPIGQDGNGLLNDSEINEVLEEGFNLFSGSGSHLVYTSFSCFVPVREHLVCVQYIQYTDVVYRSRERCVVSE